MIQVLFEHTTDDMRELAAVSQKNRPKINVRRGLKVWLVVIVSFACLICIVALHPHTNTPTPNPAVTNTSPPQSSPPLKFYLIAFGVGGIWTAYRHITRESRAKAYLARIGLYQVPITLSLDDAGVVSTVGPAETRWKWEAFDRWIETQNSFFIRLKEKARFVMIPRRAVSLPDTVDQVRSTIECNIRTQISAFPVIPLASLPNQQLG